MLEYILFEVLPDEDGSLHMVTIKLIVANTLPNQLLQNWLVLQIPKLVYDQ